MARAKKIPLITDFNHIPAEAMVPKEEQPYPIPKHWKWVRLGTVIDLLSGRDATLADCNDSGLGIPYVMGASNIRDSRLEIERWIEKPEVISHAGDLLLTVKGTVGKLYIQTEPELNLSRQLMGLHPSAVISVFYLERFFSTQVQQLSAKAVGLIPGISRAHILDLAIPLPPLEEQKQIVAYLDEKLGKIDSVREKLQNFLDHAAQRKDNLIQAAITGHLTHQWRDEHGVAREDWITKTIDELGAVVTGGTPSTKHPEFYGSDVPFIKPSDLNAGRHVTSSETYLSLLGSEQARMLPPYTVAVCCIGATISKCGLIEVKSATNQQINALVPYEENSPTYLYYLCASPSFKQMVINNSSSTTLPILNKGRFSKLMVTIPPLDEQREIARILDEQLARIDAADSKVQEALDQLNLLKEQLVSAALAGRFSSAK